jgi:anti-sigma factor RsiW
MTEDRTEKTTHERWTGKLDAYIDGELDSSQMQELDRHLRECSGCAAEALRRLQWKRAIRSSGECYVPGPAVRERIRKSISPAKPAWWQWWPAFATTAALLLVIAGARIIPLETVRQKRHLAQESWMAGELADLHVATLASANPVDVVSSDRHSVKPWFAGKIPFSFNLPELQGSPFELVGGRVSYLEQSPGAQLLFRVRKHQISVFIFQAKALPPGAAGAGEMDARSFRLERWQRDGLQYFAIGDAASEDLRALSDLLGK